MPETDETPNPQRGESTPPKDQATAAEAAAAVPAPEVAKTRADKSARAEKSNAETAKVDKKNLAKRKRSFWLELPILVLIAVIVAVVVRTFFLQTFYIPSSSMEKTLLPDDRVLVNKIVYDFREPRRGEVVVFEPPQYWNVQEGKDDYIKRVIGVGGDHISVNGDDNNRITINGKPLKETYLYPGNKPSNDRFEVTVPKGRLFVMGDHRAGSSDSRFHMNKHQGTIPVDSVVGRAFAVFWPVDRAKMLSVPDEFNGIPDSS